MTKEVCLTEDERKAPVQQLENVAKAFEDYAGEIRQHANRLMATGDTAYLQYAASAITNCLANIRIDMLVKYSSHAYRNRIARIESKASNAKT